MPSETKFCEKCKKAISVKEFYKSNNLEKYPDGYLNQCKKCITMHVDNWDPNSFMWILQECDVPYISKQWNNLLERYGRDKSTVTGLTILGRYLSAMKIKQYKDYRWKDTAFLQELEDHKTEEAMKRQGYGAAEITSVLEESHVPIPEGELSEPQYAPAAQPQDEVEDYFDRQNGTEDNEIENDLSDEDRRYLRIKWGKAYKPEEWVRLEDLYKQMFDSYDIQGAGHEDVLKLVCKTSLKANQLLDIGDVDGAQKMLKMYDSLMKSGRFTAAQNKAENGEFLNSIAEFVVLCEKEGFIPRYYTDGPKDRIDETILDLKGYTHDLVVEEMNLGNLIENAVKEMTRQEEKAEDEDVEDEMSLDELDELKEQELLDDEDYEDFNNFEEEERLASEEEIMKIIGEKK